MSVGGRLSLTEGTVRALAYMHAYRLLTIPQFARISGVSYKHGAEVLLSLERLEAVGFIGYTGIPGQEKHPNCIFSNAADLRISLKQLISRVVR